MKTVIDIIKEKLLDNDTNCVEWYDLTNIVTNWPEVKKGVENDSLEIINLTNYLKPEDLKSHNGYEYLDMENYEIISLDKDKLVFCCGGDWQEPLTFTLVADGEHNLKALDFSNSYDYGLTQSEILKILNEN